jgi:hypothetical protein
VRAWIFALSVVAACGRFGFDPHSGSAGDDAALPDTVDPGATAVDFVAAMSCETDLPIAIVPLVDQLRWLDLGGRQVVLAIYHLDNFHHEIHALVLGVNSGQIVKIEDVLVDATTDLTGLAAARTATGVLVFGRDVAGNMVHAFAFDTSFAKLGDTPLAGLEDSFEPYAKSNTAQMIAGVTPNGVVAFTVDDLGAATSSTFVVDTIADAPSRASITPLGNDFLVGWTTGAGTCKLERIDAAGASLAGPLTVAAPCTSPSATAVGASIVLAFEDPSGPAYAASTDPTLATSTTPVALGTSPSYVQQIVGYPDHAIVAVSENMGDSRIVSVATTGAVTALGTDFGLTANSNDHQTASLVAGSLLHARSEGGVLRIRKLCR